MSLSRISLVPILAAMGLVLLIGCKKEETPATDTATTAVTKTATIQTAATAATTQTATTGTTDTTGTAVAAPKYGPQTVKLEKFGTIDDATVAVKFAANNKVTATPDSPHVNALRKSDPGKPTTIQWTADDTTVKLHVRVLRPDTGPSCITGPELVSCTGNRCSAQANPAIQKLPKTTVSIACKVRIWKDGMTEPADPQVVVENCCP